MAQPIKTFGRHEGRGEGGNRGLSAAIQIKVAVPRSLPEVLSTSSKGLHGPSATHRQQPSHLVNLGGPGNSQPKGPPPPHTHTPMLLVPNITTNLTRDLVHASRTHSRCRFLGLGTTWSHQQQARGYAKQWRRGGQGAATHDDWIHNDGPKTCFIKTPQRSHGAKRIDAANGVRHGSHILLWNVQPKCAVGDLPYLAVFLDHVGWVSPLCGCICVAVIHLQWT